MFSGSRKVVSSKSNELNDNDKQLQQQQIASEAAAAVAANRATSATRQLTGSAGSQLLYNSNSNNNNNNNNTSNQKSTGDVSPEREHFLNCFKTRNCNRGKNKNKSKKAKLAEQETLDEDSDESSLKEGTGRFGCFFKMVLRSLKLKRILIPLIIISYIVAIYCLPYVDIQPSILKPLPNIPFNFRDGPLRPSTASQFKVERLFDKQIQAPESIALDSDGNMYMAIEGGSVLYAHLNFSSPIKRSYYYDLQSSATTMAGSGNNNLLLLQQQLNGRLVEATTTMTPPPPLLAATGSDHSSLSVDGQSLPNLVKIAELNPIKQLPYDSQFRKARESNQKQKRAGSGGGGGGSWRRECQLDEKIYGQQQHKVTTPNDIATDSAAYNNDLSTPSVGNRFTTNIIVSRCSKPLGIRLNPDESYLYVVDTLTGLYRISLKVPDKPHSTQRLVTKLIDFRRPKSHKLPVYHYDDSITTASPHPNPRNSQHLNVTLMAVDDLDIDFGAGTRGGDLIYLSLASQNWIAIGFLYDLVEGRPSGAILRYDSGNNQLSILDPTRIAHVRTSSYDLNNLTSRLYTRYFVDDNNGQPPQPYYGIGAPNLDENDVFDDRPLHFPNGMQLTDDKQALLIADTSNKRIIKHFIKGPRKGASDLWAWTPHYPDNIRRGYDKARETYWVVGCGEDRAGKFDMLELLNEWPRLRKFMLRQIYLVGWLIESFGSYIYKSSSVRDIGYGIKHGHTLLERNMCPGMMILQYNSYGDIIKSIHNSKEFPNDLAYYSQVNEVIDAKNQEHFLYLSSPSYNYVTKLTLPTDSFDLTATTATTINLPPSG